MTLVAGQTISHYEVRDTLGVGGMCEVYRATDTRLGRDVAIKVLPEAFVQDEERLQRFEREARTLASLNHPNVGAIHGIEQEGELRFLALELVPGEDLAARVMRGALPIGEAIDACRQIAEGLEAAHAAGVMHRDLKPANVRVTPDGIVKVLDFGLAKPTEPAATNVGLTTEEGRILGTPVYMSPEQARGREVDTRSDVWSFGCILYETLTGRRPFGGETLTDVLVAVAEKEPDWRALPSATPTSVVRLVKRCMTKDVRARLQAIGEARIVLENPGAAELESASAPRAHATRWLVPVSSGLALALAGYWLGGSARNAQPNRPPVCLTVEIPPDQHIDLPNAISGGLAGVAPPLALAPDGLAIVYVARAAEGANSLYYRDLRSFESTRLDGTENAEAPFFSPTGEWVGFFREGAIEKVAIAGGTPQPVCEVSMFDRPSATWGRDGTIVFTRGVNAAGQLHMVSANGGSSINLTEPDFSRGEVWHGMPQFLGTNAILFTIASDTGKRAAVVDLASGDRRIVENTGDAAGAKFLASEDGGGALVYAQDGRLFAVGFDPRSATIVGIPKPVLDSVSSSALGLAHWDCAQNGTLVYISGSIAASALVLRKRTGEVTWRSERGLYQHPRLSPDGKKLLYDWERNRGGRQIWLYDLEQNTPSKLTTGVKDMDPLWSRDGSRVVFSRHIAAARTLHVLEDPSKVEAPCRRLIVGDGANVLDQQQRRRHEIAGSWSRSGQMLFTISGDENEDLWVLSGLDEPKAEPLLTGRGIQGWGTLARDSRVLAYVSDEPGEKNVFICAYPDLTRKQRVTLHGGVEPLWRWDGTELFYRRGEGFWSVSVDSQDGEIRLGEPQLLFEGSYDNSPTGHQHYDVSRDGQTFALVELGKSDVPRELRVILNWRPLQEGSVSSGR